MSNYNQGYPPRPPYQQYPPQAQYPADETVSMGDWIGSLLLTCIPVVGIVMMFVWAFGGSTKPSKRNFFRASLLLSLIIGVLTFLIWLVVFLVGGMAALSFSDFS